jgi:hypothetical protein
MKSVTAFIWLCFLNLSLLFSSGTIEANVSTPQSDHKVVIVGGGIIGALESYYEYLDAIKNGTKVQIVVYEKGSSFSELASSSINSTNTAFNIFPSLTADEILSVVPRGSELTEKLAILFSEPGGIRVDDVPGANDSAAAVQFKEAVEKYGSDAQHNDRTKSLLTLGKMSMDMWQDLYAQADEELKGIFNDSNYNPCNEPKNRDVPILRDGYRIDLIYDVPEAERRAKEMQITYQQLGYEQCRVLSPKDVMALDPSLTDFCHEHTILGDDQELHWNGACSALWRPGGCIDTRIFLPKFYSYLKKMMGDNFAIEFNKELTDIELDWTPGAKIAELRFSDGSSEKDTGYSHYIFCPGEAVGTLSKLGFQEPAYAGFAGPSLFLNIPLSPDQIEKYKNFSHCMEVHKVGIVLAWQARFLDDRIMIGVAGTKAFYGDQQPTIDQDFAKNRHLIQLNMINDVLPEAVSIALGRDTKGVILVFDDLLKLENEGILQRWVGRRAVAYDGFPTLGAIYSKTHRINNSRCTTHLGSGGVSFGPAAVLMSRRCGNVQDEFTAKIIQYADSRRHP